MGFRRPRGIARPLAIAACTLLLLSFSSKFGGDHFSIYVNGSKILEQHVAMKEPVKSIYLDKYSGNDKLSVYFSECGKIGKDRVITLRDGSNKALKQWRFADAEKNAEMSFLLKEIMQVQKSNKASRLSLHYQSRDVSRGVMLAGLDSGTPQTTAAITQPDAFSERKTSLLNR